MGSSNDHTICDTDLWQLGSKLAQWLLTPDFVIDQGLGNSFSRCVHAPFLKPPDTNGFFEPRVNEDAVFLLGCHPI